ncbi:MAG: 4Fe-4S binding protein [Firmicutes bacterium]|nr:4Fe-4S binding protein [Bacillota bacterium]
MGHGVNSRREVYLALAERLNRNPLGAPVNDVLMEVLFRLYTETEAAVGSRMPMRPVTLEKAAEVTGIEAGRLDSILDQMADKGLIMDFSRRGGALYVLAPMVIGFFEYTFMRAREEVDMKELAELFESYFKYDQVREEFFGRDTQLFKTLVYEKLIPAVVETEVLDYERASEIIRRSGGGALSMCSCRHKARHLGKACGAPLEVCTTLGSPAQWLVKRGMGRPASVDELLRVLDQTEKEGLVHLGDNVLDQHIYICHCCGCCCEVLRTTRETGLLAAHPSNFIPALDPDLCAGCGVCADSCQVGAIEMREDTAVIKADLCLGCGACAASCPTDALAMKRRAVLHHPPATKAEQMSRMMKEKNRA